MRKTCAEQGTHVRLETFVEQESCVVNVRRLFETVRNRWTLEMGPLSVGRCGVPLLECRSACRDGLCTCE